MEGWACVLVFFTEVLTTSPLDILLNICYTILFYCEDSSEYLTILSSSSSSLLPGLSFGS